jgi:hypothetical protein
MKELLFKTGAKRAFVELILTGEVVARNLSERPTEM